MPRRLLRDGAIVVDEWRTSGDGAVADDDALLLALPEFRAERERWLARTGPLGVILAPADHEQDLVPDLSRLALVAAEFPAVSEGRGYTQGRLLCERGAPSVATTSFCWRAAVSTASSCRKASSRVPRRHYAPSPPPIR
jgi:uncharacterized protein (DUF934 family)